MCCAYAACTLHVQARLANLELPVPAREREALAQQRDALRLETDEALAQLDQQQHGQALLESLGCGVVIAS